MSSSIFTTLYLSMTVTQVATDNLYKTRLLVFNFPYLCQLNDTFVPSLLSDHIADSFQQLR